MTEGLQVKLFCFGGQVDAVTDGDIGVKEGVSQLQKEIDGWVSGTSSQIISVQTNVAAGDRCTVTVVITVTYMKKEK